MSDIPIEHVDYDYVKGCNDPNYLAKILLLLRSGKEGVYPDLERVTEEKLRSLNPDHRALRKSKPAMHRSQLPKDERKSYEEQLALFEAQAEGQTVSKQKHQKPLPPVRGTAPAVEASAASTQQKLPTTVDVSDLTETAKVQQAELEKQKGNECLRSKDYEEAILYYSRSLSIVDSTAVHNNRCLAYLKAQKFAQCDEEANVVLGREPNNLKARLRRAWSRVEQKRYADAKEDLTIVEKADVSLQVARFARRMVVITPSFSAFMSSTNLSYESFTCSQVIMLFHFRVPCQTCTRFLCSCITKEA
eukprot:m.83944 g.83944  ORF g.83944 m.83944 type:complete len:304 (+) comp12733_c1_seq1:108-1019(+)